MRSAGAPRVLVVGSGWRFTSGISYYTCRLSNALAAGVPTSALLMRRLVPRLLYPGRARVGTRVHDLEYDPAVEVYDGVDWSWGRSLLGALVFLRRQRPDVLVLQWWTGAVLHSYLVLVAAARWGGAKVVVEWHEVQDTGEARLPLVVPYVRAAMRLLLRGVDGHVVHSAFDREQLVSWYGWRETALVRVVAHGPYDHHRAVAAAPTDGRGGGRPLQLLFFGTIRPYKGLEDLVAAFEALPEVVRAQMHLTIVGETWEGWTAPLEAVGRSTARADITVVNRYVTDAEVARFFAEADAVVLPYRRSSASGPLHIAMSTGLPVVVSAVGGLVEAVGEYEGAVLVPPADPAALATALADLLQVRGRRYADPHDWQRSVAAYLELFTAAGVRGAAQPDDAFGRADLSAAKTGSPAPGSTS